MGSYQYAVAGDTWQWSDGVYAIHGFHRGEVVPTTALLLSHAHAADRRHAGRCWAAARATAGSSACSTGLSTRPGSSGGS